MDQDWARPRVSLTLSIIRTRNPSGAANNNVFDEDNSVLEENNGYLYQCKILIRFNFCLFRKTILEWPLRLTFLCFWCFLTTFSLVHITISLNYYFWMHLSIEHAYKVWCCNLGNDIFFPQNMPPKNDMFPFLSVFDVFCPLNRQFPTFGDFLRSIYHHLGNEKLSQ